MNKNTCKEDTRLNRVDIVRNGGKTVAKVRASSGSWVRFPNGKIGFVPKTTIPALGA